MVRLRTYWFLHRLWWVKHMLTLGAITQIGAVHSLRVAWGKNIKKGSKKSIRFTIESRLMHQESIFNYFFLYKLNGIVSRIFQFSLAFYFKNNKFLLVYKLIMNYEYINNDNLYHNMPKLVGVLCCYNSISSYYKVGFFIRLCI